MLSENQYELASNCLKMLAQPVRLKIIDLLLKKGELSVNQISNDISCSQSLTSEHLKLLKLCNFLDSKKDGKKTIYFIIENHLINFIDCIYKKFGGENGNKKN